MLNQDQKAIINQAIEILETEIKSAGQVFTDPDMVRSYLALSLRPLEREVFAVMFLNNQHALIEFEIMFKGTIDSSSVHPREVVKAALLHNAAALIFAHNHPSGVAEPSQADRRITDRLVQILDMVEIRVLDHFIVGDGEIFSFAESGLI